MSKLKSYSASALNAAAQCGEKFRRLWIEKEWGPTNAAMARGKAVHEVARESHRRQIKAKDKDKPDAAVLPELLATVIPSVEEAKDLAADTFDKEIAASEEPAEKKGAEKDTAVASAETYIVEAAPIVNPVSVEREIILLPSTLPGIRIKGVVDLIEAETPALNKQYVLKGYTEVLAEREVIRDRKTASKRPKGDEADKSTQLSMYSLLRRMETKDDEKKENVHRVSLDYIVKPPKSKPYVQRLESERTDDDLRVLYRRIMSLIKQTDAGIFPPAPEGAWWCSARWCDFYTSCQYIPQRLKDAALKAKQEGQEVTE